MAELGEAEGGRQEGAPVVHSIAWSARSSTAGGMVQAERLSGFQVNDHLERGGLFHRGGAEQDRVRCMSGDRGPRDYCVPDGFAQTLPITARGYRVSAQPLMST